MKLAEALIERADLQKRIEQVRSRIATNARYQEGAEPEEDATALLAEAERMVATLERLLLRINTTNAATTLRDGSTVTALLARRDALRLRHSLVSGAADAAAGSNGYRQLRSELRTMAALPVADLRKRVDDLARSIREVDVVIQRTNWEVDLAD
ncbi:DIP1984 family protein [Curtobacterium sp. Leaf261]|uniref:DIP1984 family protein n=1 Tax=Curtobacterium sp. Leaf261 TaxID=1736311 RepID=UPI0006F645C4|nr:DIP1984 family protein [Curtobacterium sp. Leaf261]KQO63800.1 hypothetical protein ASF23_06225 [Curtobacterium sp. Leaf261]